MEQKKHTFLNIVIFVIVAITSLFLYAKYIGIKGLVVKEYRIQNNTLPSNFSGVKIVHFSDLLYKSTVTNNDVIELIDKINLYKPDIVVFTGDLVNKNVKLKAKDQSFLIEQLSNIHSTIGKYAISGDYDFYLKDYENIMTESGFTMIDNNYEELFYGTNESIYIVGLPSSIKSSIKLEEAFKFYDENNQKWTILLLHDGNTIKYLDNSSYEVNLILGGHSLNGSVVVPYYGGLFIDKYSYKYYDSYYQKGITDIYISSGIGTNNYKYRFNNKPSINVYRLKAQS